MEALRQRSEAGRKLLNRADLIQRGIKWSREHLRRQVLAGKFPAPIRLVDGKSAPLYWFEGDIDQFIETRVRKAKAPSE